MWFELQLSTMTDRQTAVSGLHILRSTQLHVTVQHLHLGIRTEYVLVVGPSPFLIQWYQMRSFFLVALLAQGLALRFNVGDRVECHMEGDTWVPGVVTERHVEQDGLVMAYVARLDTSEVVTAPFDDDRFIRAEGAGGASSLRFCVGARVECNLGMHWELGTVTRLNYRGGGDEVVPYQVELDSGGRVFAPADDESVIRREGSIQVSDPGLRFSVGDRVECRFDGHGQTRWEAGRVVALHYHEPSFGAATMPYQVKLDGDARLIYVTRDDAYA